MNSILNAPHQEYQYLDLVKRIMDFGHEKKNERTGIGTKSIHGAMLRFDLSNGVIPLLTTKRVPWKAIIHELLWFLSGETNIRPLVLNNVHIWSDWPHEKYIKETGDAISMEEFEARIASDAVFAAMWGDLGPVYGKQWRRWEGPDGRVYDQISDVLEQLKVNPESRRLLFHGWNVADIDKMALPPCHLLYQFYVNDNRLSMTLYQRSVDVGLGLPFNIASAAAMVNMFAQQTGLEPGELVWFGHDVHLYKNHLDLIKPQLSRIPYDFPTLTLTRLPTSLFDYEIGDFELVNYKSHPKISMPVAV